jgi:hypothetical protein
MQEATLLSKHFFYRQSDYVSARRSGLFFCIPAGKSKGARASSMTFCKEKREMGIDIAGRGD